MEYPVILEYMAMMQDNLIPLYAPFAGYTKKDIIERSFQQTRKHELISI
jgi:hypothetical protein